MFAKDKLSKEKRVLSVAFDYSSGDFRMVLSADGALLADVEEKLPIRRFAASISIIVGALESIGAEVADVRRWTCGTGPGGFTALRASAALAMGLASHGGANGRAVSARGVPSVAALGAELAELRPDAETAAVLYDAKGGGVIRCALERRDGVMRPVEGDGFAAKVANPERLVAFDALVAYSTERVSLESALPGIDGVEWLERFPVERLLDFPEYPWGEGLDSPLYLRPSTDAKPYAWKK